eukprot:6123480-Prymnesium_polylepis.1
MLRADVEGGVSNLRTALVTASSKSNEKNHELLTLKSPVRWDQSTPKGCMDRSSLGSCPGA